MDEQNATTLRSGLATLLRRSAPVEWRDWLPFASAAGAAPEAWIGAVSGMRADQQFELLERLHTDGAGPFADALLVLTAQYVNEIDDEQVREYVLQDAVEAEGRNLERLAALRDHLAALQGRVEAARARQVDGLDLAAEVLRLQQELLELRSRESDEEYARVHELEREILRAETRRRILAHYDADGRRRTLEELAEEVTVLDDRKRETERAIAATIAERDSARREQARAEAELTDARRESEERQRLVAEAQAGLAAIRAATDDGRRELERLRRELGTHREEAERLERERRALEETVRTERGRLDELRSSAVSAGLTELARKLDEVYALLPPDRAEQAF